MRMIRSNYYDGKQFEMYIIREDEEFYYVQLTEEFQNEFQEKDSVTPLSKHLVGDETNLYSIIEKEYQQIYLF